MSIEELYERMDDLTALFRSNMTTREIAEELEISKKTIKNLRNRYDWLRTNWRFKTRDNYERDKQNETEEP